MVKKTVEQPEVNIGLIGHVDHGKTTLTERLTGKWTDTHSEELKRGITIRLGYANTTIYQCEKCKPKRYTVHEKCETCKGATKKIRTVSFIDAPGHESLMATMLSGAAVMDGAVLLVSANEKCPQPQTREHLMALEIIGCENIIVAQNKIDLVSKEEALNNYKQIKAFLKGTIAEKAPVIPISAQHGTNIEFLIDAIETVIKTPKRDPKKSPLMFIARSFDVNKPGTDIAKLLGGVMGGVIREGVLKEGDKVTILPGSTDDNEGKKEWKPVHAKIVGLKTGKDDIKEAHPGGSIAVLTSLDPYYIKGDAMTGNVLGIEGKMPEVRHELIATTHLLKRTVGAKEDIAVENIKLNEMLMLNVNAASTIGTVTKLQKGKVSMNLRLPVCCFKGDRITISRMMQNRWRLIGYGIIE